MRERDRQLEAEQRLRPRKDDPRLGEHLLDLRRQRRWLFLLHGPLPALRAKAESQTVPEYSGQQAERACVSAWNKDPVFGVIGIQSGPRGLRVHTGFHDYGSRGWDADCGDDCEDSPGVFWTGQID